MKLEELEKLCEDASDLPWYTNEFRCEEDQKLIVAARTYMPKLIAVCKAARDITMGHLEKRSDYKCAPSSQFEAITKALDDLEGQ